MTRPPKPRDPSADLGRRERQIMDVLYRLGRATAAEVRAELPDPPTYSSVRGMLRHLVPEHITLDIATARGHKALIDPAAILPGSPIRRIIESAVIDFPQPDSPTSASISPASM